MPGADIERVGQPLRLLQAGIVTAVEEILERAAHVAEVLGRAEDHRVGCQHVVRTGLQGRAIVDLDPLDLGGARTGQDGLEQPSRIGGRGVGNHQ